MNNNLFLLFTIASVFALESCVQKSPKAKLSTLGRAVSQMEVTSVEVKNNQLIIRGTNFQNNTQVALKNAGNSYNFSVESISSNEIVANGIAAFNFATNVAFDLILSNAQAASTFAVNFSLCDSLLGGVPINCLVTPTDKDVLSYDAVSGKWKPRAISGLSYQGTWDANDPFPSTTSSGDYFIVSVANSPYNVGDWIVFNGSTYDLVANGSAVTNVFGRTGAVTSVEGDYVLDKLGDVDTTTAPPLTNDVLKYNGTKWVPGTVVSSGGTVTNVSATAPVSVSNGTTTPTISIPPASTTTNGFLTSTDWNTFNNKQSAITAGTTAQYYRGDKSWQTLNTDAVSEGAVNLYFTNARTLGVPLTGFSTNNSTIVASDTVLQALEKAQGQINNLTSGGSNFLVKNGTDTITGTVNVGPTGFLTIANAPSILIDATNKQYVDTRDALKVNKTGDTISGILTLDNELKIKGGSNYVTVKGNVASASYNFVLPTTAGTNGFVLTTDGSGNLSWTNPAAGGTTLIGDITGTTTANTIGAGKVTLTHLSATGIRDNTTYLRGDNTFTSLATDVRATALTGLSTATNAVITATDSVMSAFGKLQKQITDVAITPIGGDLTGNLPNPTIAKIQGSAVTITSVANKQVLKYNGSAWVNSQISASDLSAIGTPDTSKYLSGDNLWKSFDTSVSMSPLTGLSTAGINYGNSLLIGSDPISTAFNKLKFTQGDYVSKTADQTINGNLKINSLTGFITVPDPVTGKDAANKDYVDGFGQWTKGTGANAGDIYRSSGNVGIGIMNPLKKLDVNGDILISGITVGLGGGNIPANTAVGHFALRDNTIGAYNTANGESALATNTSGNYNTASGYRSLFVNIDGSQNTSFGSTSLTSNTNGSFNTAIGDSALYSNTTGSQNIAIGQNAGRAITTGNNNVIIGSNYGSTIATLSNHILISDGAGAERMRFNAAGNAGIGVPNPTYALQVNGQVAGTLAYATTSDERFKKDIVTIPNSLKKILSLDGVYYHFRNDEFPDRKFSSRREMGVIAQKVEKIFPEAVSKDDKGYRSVAYSMLIAPLIEGFKELYYKLTDHDQQLATQARSIAALKAENKMLKDYLCSKDESAPICE